MVERWVGRFFFTVIMLTRRNLYFGRKTVGCRDVTSNCTFGSSFIDYPVNSEWDVGVSVPT